MNYKVRFDGEESNIAKAILAMQDFNTVIPVPDGINIYKMVPIAEDYFYYLLSKKGIISKEQGEKSLERFKKEIEKMGTQTSSLFTGYKCLAEFMLTNYEEYGAYCTDAWKQKHWGLSEQPIIKVTHNNEVLLSDVDSVPQGIVDAICDKYAVVAQIKAL